MDLSTVSTIDKERLAKNPNTPEDVLRELAKDKDPWIRVQVAKNPSTPLDILRELAKEDNWYVRAAVAQNPSTPLDILRGLAKDDVDRVRYYVAKHPKGTSKLLLKMFEYEKSLRKPDGEVIRALYTHKNLPAFAKRVIETLFGEMLT